MILQVCLSHYCGCVSGCFELSSGFFLILKLMRTFCQQITRVIDFDSRFLYWLDLLPTTQGCQGSWALAISYVPLPGFQFFLGEHTTGCCDVHLPLPFFRSGLSYIHSPFEKKSWKKNVFLSRFMDLGCFLVSKKVIFCLKKCQHLASPFKHYFFDFFWNMFAFLFVNIVQPTFHLGKLSLSTTIYTSKQLGSQHHTLWGAAPVDAWEPWLNHIVVDFCEQKNRGIPRFKYLVALKGEKNKKYLAPDGGFNTRFLLPLLSRFGEDGPILMSMCFSNVWWN